MLWLSAISSVIVNMGCSVRFHHGSRTWTESRRNLSHATLKISADTQTSERLRCGYSNNDIYDADYFYANGVDDNAKTKVKKRYRRGIASRLVSIGRSLIETRVLAIQLSGKLAHKLVAATYGIITAKVPKACFSELRNMLKLNAESSYKDMKKHSVKLRRFISTDVRRECNDNGKVTKRGKAASKVLLQLRYGYWSLHADMTSERWSEIAARNVDARRAEKGNRQMRQVWHFARIHMLMETEPEIRKELLKRHISRTEAKRIKAQLEVLFKLSVMRNARLEFVELNKYKPCKKVDLNDPTEALEAAGEDKFRVTLMFRERGWQETFKAFAKFFKHPLWFIGKQVSRTRQEWASTTVGHRLGMILSTTVKLVGIAGLVLGVATLGQSTLTSVIVAAIAPEIASYFAYAGMAEFLLSRVVASPLAAVAMDTAVARANSWLLIQRILAKLDDEEVVMDVRERIEEEVENILSRPEITKQMIAMSADSKDTDPIDIEEEVRRYVTHLVYGAFQDEVLPQLREELAQRESLNDPAFGWLPWNQWAAHRNGTNAKVLKGKKIDNRDTTNGVSTWSGVVTSYSRKWMFGTGDRNIWVQLPTTQTIKVKLTDQIKQRIWVLDKEAYRNYKTGWLLWHDWVEYRSSNTDTKLEKKTVYIDPNLRRGKCRNLKGACEKAIMQEIGIEDEEKGFIVKTTHWKRLDGGIRNVIVKGTGLQICETDGFRLTFEVKHCLRVKDSKAYNKWTLDAGRRAEEAKWNEGKDVKLTDEIVKEMCKTSKSGLTVAAKKSNALLEKEYKMPSVELEMEAQAGSEGVGRKEVEDEAHGDVTLGTEVMKSKDLAKAQLVMQDAFVNSVYCEEDGKSASTRHLSLLAFSISTGMMYATL